MGYWHKTVIEGIKQTSKQRQGRGVVSILTHFYKSQEQARNEPAPRDNNNSNNNDLCTLMCYISKLEHVAHYKAKNQNTVKINF